MSKDWLKGIKSAYDTVIIGSGLAGLTAANKLAKLGHKVLVLEHHYNLGGLATWFKRKVVTLWIFLCTVSRRA